MPSLNYAPVSTVRDLDELPYALKLRHWMRDDAWAPEGDRLRFKNPKAENFAVVMRDGHIIRMPLLIGRPCFGILTAFLRYKDETKLVKGRGRQPASRCGTCKIRPHCERVVRNRIAASARLQQAYRDWLIAEGPASFTTPNWKQDNAGRTWGRLCRAAYETHFDDSNLSAVAEHYREQDATARESDRLRKQRTRTRDERAGILDDAHLFDMHVAAAHRLDDLVEAIDRDDTPRALRQVPEKSLIEMMEVWVCRTFLRACHMRVSAAAIARLIEHWKLRNDSANFAALSTRVARDLARIAHLEKVPWDGWVLLPPFDGALEFAD